MKKLCAMAFLLLFISACGSSGSNSGSETSTVYDVSVEVSPPSEVLLLKNGLPPKTVTVTVGAGGEPLEEALTVTVYDSGGGALLSPAEGETRGGRFTFEVSAVTNAKTDGKISVYVAGSAASELSYTVIESAAVTELWGSEVSYNASLMEGVDTSYTVKTPAGHEISMTGKAVLFDSGIIASVTEEGDLQFEPDRAFLTGKGGEHYDTLRLTADGAEVLLAVKLTVADGSAAYPYPIGSKKELQAIGYSNRGVYPNLDKSYIMTDNISMKEDDIPWAYIGNTYPAVPFKGYFNGGGKTIYDYNTGLPLFALVDAAVTVDPDDPDATPEIPVIIERLHIETVPEGITYTSIASLLINQLRNGIVQYVSAGGKLTATSNAAGLISSIASTAGGILRRCYSSIEISGGGTNTSPIVASLTGAGNKIEDCYSTGKASGSTYTGGIEAAQMSGCDGEGGTGVYRTYSTGDLFGTTTIYGIAGFGAAGCNLRDNIALNRELYGSGSLDRVTRMGRNNNSSAAFMENNYAYANMSLRTSQGGGSTKTATDDINGADGKSIAPMELTKDFFTRGADASGLGWGEEVWDFEFDEPERSWKLPIIKGYREAEQKAFCLPAHLRADPGYVAAYPYCP